MRGRRLPTALRMGVFLNTSKFGNWGRTIHDDIEDAESMARRVLADAGLPTKLGWYIKHEDGRFELAPRPKFKSLVDTLNSKAKILSYWARPWPSTASDAVNVLVSAGVLRRGLSEGVEPLKLAQMATDFGRRVDALSVSRADVWRLADAGQRSREGASLGGLSREHAMPATHRLAYADALERCRKKTAAGLCFNKSEIAGHVAKAHRISKETVRDWLKSVPDPHRKGKLGSKAPSPPK